MKISSTLSITLALQHQLQYTKIDGQPEMMANGTDIQDSSKRKVDMADMSSGEDSISRLKKKARLRGQCAAPGFCRDALNRS